MTKLLIAIITLTCALFGQTSPVSRVWTYAGTPTSGDCTTARVGHVAVDTSTDPDLVYDCVVVGGSPLWSLRLSASTSLTASSLVTASSANGIQTPSSTSTLDSSGNLSVSGRSWSINALTYTSGSSLPGTCAFGDRFLLTTTSIWYFCYSANAWEASTSSANDSVTLGNHHVSGHMSIGNEAQPDRDVDTCILCLRDTSLQNTDHSIGLSVTNIWVPSSNANNRSFATVDTLGYVAAGGGVTVPFATGFSENFGLVSGTVTASRGFGSATPAVFGGGITTRWGLYFADQCASGITNCYAMETLGGGHLFGDYLNVTGRSDTTQFKVRGHSTQTSPLLRLENNGGTVVTTVSNTGVIASATWQGVTVGVPYGGTGATNFTANGVLYGAGTGAVAATGTGTAGQILTSNGPGSAPTFQDAAAGGGGWVLLETKTASSSASLDFTSCISSTYDNYVIQIQELLPSTDGAAINLRVSTDGGSSYVSTSSYAWNNHLATNGVAAVQGSLSATAISLAFNQDSDTTLYGFSGTYYFYNPGGSSLRKVMQGTGFLFTSAGFLQTINGYGAYAATTAVTDFQILAGSGNLASGIARCYGITK